MPVFLHDVDRFFLAEAGGDGMAEARLGHLAAERAANPKVRQYGQHLADDHGRANVDLVAVAAKKGMMLPAELMAKYAGAIRRLSGLSGNDFDREYMEYMIRSHERAVSVFRREISDGYDHDLQRFAVTTLPMLEEHLRKARELFVETG